MTLKEYLYNEIHSVLASWDEKDIYAISFFVYFNECNCYNGIKNFPEFSVGYNTETDCGNAHKHSKVRWNFAFWCQNNIDIITPYVDTTAKLLLEWYNSIGLSNIGEEERNEDMYDENMRYIGKGPKGYYEFLMLISEIARQIQTEGTIKEKFGSIPIIIHDLEYPWYIEKATENANPFGEAEDFLHFVRNM